MTSEYRKQEQSQARRRAAWELLQDTRNPEYVALRYGYPIETMREALKKIPEPEQRPFKRSPAAEACHNQLQRIGEIVPPGAFGKRAASSRVRSREPGEDDDLGEGNQECLEQ